MKNPFFHDGWLQGVLIEDPLRSFFSKRFIAYFVLLFICLLWPFDLLQKNRVRWLADQPGIEFVGNGIVISPDPPHYLYKKMLSGNGFSLEVWLSVADNSQSGPARIVSYSLNTVLRNFSIGQQCNLLDIRIRTNRTDLNGVKPSMVVDNIFNSAERLHIVVTYDWEKETVYVNGLKRKEDSIPGGDFSTWDPKHHLYFGNEGTADRPWIGKLFRVSLYNRPLGHDEIVKHFDDGVTGDLNLFAENNEIMEGLVSDYRFTEGMGRNIGETSGNDDPINLYIPKFRRNYFSTFLHGPNDSFRMIFKKLDSILNILGFIPVGLFLHGMLRNKWGLSVRLSIIVLALGFTISFLFESLQYLSVERDSSSVDLLNNTIGICLGILIDYSYINQVKYYWKMQSQK
jgi:VanZ family protein